MFDVELNAKCLSVSVRVLQGDWYEVVLLVYAPEVT